MQTKPSACKCLKVRTETRGQPLAKEQPGPSARESAVCLLSLCLLPASAPTPPRLHQPSTPGHFRFLAARLESTFAEINFTKFSTLQFILSQEVSSKGDEPFPLLILPLCSFTPARCILGDSTVTPEDGCSGVLLTKISLSHSFIEDNCFGVRSLGQEDPVEQETAPSSSIFARKIPWAEEPDGLQRA